MKHLEAIAQYRFSFKHCNTTPARGPGRYTGLASRRPFFWSSGSHHSTISLRALENPHLGVRESPQEGIQLPIPGSVRNSARAPFQRICMRMQTRRKEPKDDAMALSYKSGANNRPAARAVRLESSRPYPDSRAVYGWIEDAPSSKATPRVWVEGT